MVKETPTMGKPTPYSASVLVPLPNDSDVARIIGDAYDPDTALNVLKMMSGTGDLFPALIGMVKLSSANPISTRSIARSLFCVQHLYSIAPTMAGQRANGQKRGADDR